MKTAILQCADSGPVESLELMLRHAGYRCFLPDEGLRSELNREGLDTVFSPEDLVRGWGYDPVDLPRCGVSAMDSCDLYVDVKAHRNYPKVTRRWHRLKGRILWYRINGGAPEHVINYRGDMGDERNPPCPVVTPNLHYREDGPWKAKSYAFWPPFARWGEYDVTERSVLTDPICLVHNFKGWGYGLLGDLCRERLGLKIYGRGSPDGLINHQEAKAKLKRCIAYLHLKSSDAPGYALYEALASGCPCVVPRRLIWRNRMQELFVDGSTCLVFDRETHDSLTDITAGECFEEISAAMMRLTDGLTNATIGVEGRIRLASLMWNVERDGPGFCSFMEEHFP